MSSGKTLSLDLFGDEDLFTAADYVAFSFLMLVSSGIGIYYAFMGVHKTQEEFVLGGRSLHGAPVAMSLTASFMSAVTVLGTPAEIYRFGMEFALFAISHTLMVALTAHVYGPVYYRQHITTAYQYLELRFNNKYLRMTGTVLFILQTISYSGIVIYVPSLALNQVTGFALWGAIIGTGVICTFYCTMGGLKAVVWTDVFQYLLMICSFILVIGRTVSIQGFRRIMDDARNGGRLAVWDFDTSPYQRHTFWTIVVGGTFTWLGVYAGNQAQVQRYLSCKKLSHVKLALYINLLGLWLTLTCATLSGLSMYSMFKDCDPWTAKLVKTPDQDDLDGDQMYFLVVSVLRSGEVANNLTAIPEVRNMYTVSSGINALATVTVEDFVKPHFKLSEGDLSTISMGMNLFFGTICIAMAGLASVLTSVVQVALTIFGIFGGPLLGILSLGILLPSANSKGAFSGLVSGLIIILWVGIGSQLYPPQPHRASPLYLSTEGCHIHNVTIPSTPATPPVSPRPAIIENWYNISYLYLSPFGSLVAFLVGTVVSLLTGGLEQAVDSSLLYGKEDLIADYVYLKAKAAVIYASFHPAHQEVS